jgi:hypothetical protein
MNRTDSNRAGLPAGLELLRNFLQKLRSLALIDRSGQLEQQVQFFGREAERHGRLQAGRATMAPRGLQLQEATAWCGG